MTIRWRLQLANCPWSVCGDLKPALLNLMIGPEPIIRIFLMSVRFGIYRVVPRRRAPESLCSFIISVNWRNK